jgi:hypothetical protein
MLITMYCAGPDVAINFAFSPRLDILSASFVTPPQRSAAGKISSTRSSSSGANQNRRSRSKFTTLERCTG